MIKVVGIRFQRAGKIYYFDPLDYDLETAMHVIVETARGVEMGTVLIPPKQNTHLIIISCCSILPQTEELISVNWLRIWHLYFAHVLNCVRSVCVMRQRCWEESVSVEESFAANRILQTLFRYRSRWQRNRIFH